MRKIINGKMYNTDTATLIDSYDSMGDLNDYRHYREFLYLKKTGEFFTYGYGGAASKYAEIQGNRMRSPGEMIIPLSRSEAMAWVERYCDVEIYIELFGEVEE